MYVGHAERNLRFVLDYIHIRKSTNFIISCLGTLVYWPTSIARNYELSLKRHYVNLNLFLLRCPYDVNLGCTSASFFFLNFDPKHN